MDPERFIDLFFEENQLRKMLCYLCDACAGHIIDPVTEITCMMIQCPIQLVVTEIGIAPFKDRLTVVYPYSKMNHVQREFIADVVRNCELAMQPPTVSSSPFHGKNVDDDEGSDKKKIFQQTPYMGMPNVSTNPRTGLQMGGGCIIHVPMNHAHFAHYMDTHSSSSADCIITRQGCIRCELVLECLCKSIISSKSDSRNLTERCALLVLYHIVMIGN